MADWQDKVVDLLRSPCDDLVSLARLAGANPADFYLGADLTGIELTHAEAQALGVGGFGAEHATTPESVEPEASILDQAELIKEPSDGRKGSVAFNIGSRRTQVARPGVGVVIDEPTLVVAQPRGRFLYGQEAANYLAEGPLEASGAWPFQADKIADVPDAARLIREFARRAGGARAISGQDVLFCLPASATGHERRMILEALRKAGLNRVGFVDAPLAIAVGAGASVDTPRAAMVLNVADSLAEVEVISLSGAVYVKAARAGTEVMDQLIIDHCRRRHDLLIGSWTAERIRDAVGAASTPRMDKSSVEVRGRSLSTGKPRDILFTSAEAVAALAPAVSDIVELAKRAMEATPAELSIDISDSGFILAGAGASLEGLARELSNSTGLRVHVPADPHLTAIHGCACLIADGGWLNNPAVMRER
ncbi:hypothetical protein ER13_03720 [Brevundimonas sp. EAKA]|uniref:rod shape-determining protein n=1 Tax=Brevundimonas sp. EAKA TaxID=1495854 RepID=UPI0004A97DFB|nr:rod shape-determining protein [Brevundimonas sp. EAKA]KDP93134.1 hypothetical protein ER13_03720 [Brevundimonas sp. EAKA]